MNRLDWYFSFSVLMTLFIIQIISPTVLPREICQNGCMVPNHLNSKVQFEAFYHNGSKVESSNIKCFPINTKLLFFCKNEFLNQINPKDDYYRECSGKGWKDSRDLFSNEFPNCVQRESDCFSPSGINGFKTRINGRIVSADNETKSYLSGTKAYYSCIDPNNNISMKLENGSTVIIEMFYRQCAKKTKKWVDVANKNLSEEIEPTCILRKQDEDNLGGHKTMPEPMLQIAETDRLNITTKIRPTPSSTSSSVGSEWSSTHFSFSNTEYSPHNSETSDKTKIFWYSVPIGVCCFVIFVLIGVLLVYRKRLGNENDSKPPVLEAEQITEYDGPSPCDSGQAYQQHRTQNNESHNEENFVYENIIAIKMNSEPIYTQVETGNATQNEKSHKTKVGLSNGEESCHYVGNEINDESQTIYAEIFSKSSNKL